MQLQQADVSCEQADAQAEALRDAVAESVAIKAQVEGVEQRLEAKINTVEQRLLGAEISEFAGSAACWWRSRSPSESSCCWPSA